MSSYCCGLSINTVGNYYGAGKPFFMQLSSAQISRKPLYFYFAINTQQLKGSFRQDIQSKFTDDLERLLELIFEKGKWNGDIKEFIFIVNTMYLIS